MVAAFPKTIMNEVADFLSTDPTPQQILDYQPSANLLERIHQLLEMNRGDSLGTQERAELNEFALINDFMSLMKIRVHKKLAEG